MNSTYSLYLFPVALSVQQTEESLIYPEYR